MAKLIKVRCSVEIQVEWQDSWLDPFEALEKEGCQGTGIVRSLLTKAIDEHNAKNKCWVCSLDGQAKIIAVDGVPCEAK